jgi:hypothetical protein
MKFDFTDLLSLVGRSASDAGVMAIIECEPDRIERFEHVGYVSLKNRGISVMFVEAAWLGPNFARPDPKALRVSGFHLHRAGHEGFSEYLGPLPGEVRFGDTQEEIERKLGRPLAIGGGGFTTILNKPIPRWVRYRAGESLLQFQLDLSGRNEMATVYIPDHRVLEERGGLI